MLRDAPFVVGESYHVFNRGAHKNKIFIDDGGYVRFLLLLHLANNTERVDMREILRKYKGEAFSVIFEKEYPDKELVDILAYCLMPNHFHLVLRQKVEDGISLFLRRTMTGYAMYFNLSKKHSGTLFQGPAKSRLIDNESYFRYIFAYIHLNPLDLVEPHWKEKGVFSNPRTKNFLYEYSYSSFFDYTVAGRPERSILAYDVAPDFLKSSNDFEDLLRWHEGGNLFNTLPF